MCRGVVTNSAGRDGCERDLRLDCIEPTSIADGKFNKHNT